MVKKIKDYYEQMYAKYPDVPKKDINRILNYGWKQYYLFNSYGGDVIINDQTFWMLCGSLTVNSLKHFNRYIRKLSTKLRIFYKRKKVPYDGYYYFALSEKQYQSIQPIKGKAGPKKRHICYGNQVLYRIKDECIIRVYNRPYIYRVRYLIPSKFSLYYPNFTTDKAELVEVLKPRKFKDILVANKEYELLN